MAMRYDADLMREWKNSLKNPIFTKPSESKSNTLENLFLTTRITSKKCPKKSQEVPASGTRKRTSILGLFSSASYSTSPSRQTNDSQGSSPSVPSSWKFSWGPSSWSFRNNSVSFVQADSVVGQVMTEEDSIPDENSSANGDDDNITDFSMECNSRMRDYSKCKVSVRSTYSSFSSFESVAVKSEASSHQDVASSFHPVCCLGEEGLQSPQQPRRASCPAVVMMLPYNPRRKPSSPPKRAMSGCLLRASRVATFAY